MKAAQYFRASNHWSKWIGKKGKVVASTVIYVAAPQHAHQVPYSYVIVDLGQEKKEFMGAGREILEVGDQVVCVLRKESKASPEGIIDYGIKVTRWNEKE